jgi:hypothetical protein
VDADEFVVAAMRKAPESTEQHARAVVQNPAAQYPSAKYFLLPGFSGIERRS